MVFTIRLVSLQEKSEYSLQDLGLSYMKKEVVSREKRAKNKALLPRKKMLSVDFCLHLTGQSYMICLVLGDWEPVVTFLAFLVKASKRNMNDNSSGISINNLPRGPTKNFHCFILPTRHKNTTNSHLLFSSFHKMKELLTLKTKENNLRKVNCPIYCINLDI